MVQEIETEHLDCCPFCGSKAELKVSDMLMGGNGYMVRVHCKECHCLSNAYPTGQTVGFEHVPSRYITLEEAKANAREAWNRRMIADVAPAKEEYPIDEINILPCFAAHEPKPEKMRQKERYFAETGLLQSQIVLDRNNNLIDGYISYLLAKAHGLRHVPIRYTKRQIVRACHKPGGKLYAWELPKSLLDRISVGDEVAVHTKSGVKVVTVAAVEEYAGNEPEPFRMVIRRKVDF